MLEFRACTLRLVHYRLQLRGERRVMRGDALEDVPVPIFQPRHLTSLHSLGDRHSAITRAGVGMARCRLTLAVGVGCWALGQMSAWICGISREWQLEPCDIVKWLSKDQVSMTRIQGT